MRTIHTTAYQFDELSNDAKERARDWYREGALDYEWWDSIEEDTKIIAQALGLQVEKLYFTGFCSQGDGACLTGAWYASDMNLKDLWAHIGRESNGDKRLLGIGATLADIVQCVPASSATLRHTGNYYHEYSVTIDVDTDEGMEDPSGDYEEYFDQDEHLVFEEQITECLRDLMRWTYRQLEAEYDYQMSDESVDENIRANDYEFTERGTRCRYQ